MDADDAGKEGLESCSSWSSASSLLVFETEEAACFWRVLDRVFESTVAARCDASRVTRRPVLIVVGDDSVM